ncbi:MAG: hypothetical protein RL653_1010 [Pseudomonadota bacterium]|jgi:hypothetical protein
MSPKPPLDAAALDALIASLETFVRGYPEILPGSGLGDRELERLESLAHELVRGATGRRERWNAHKAAQSAPRGPAPKQLSTIRKGLKSPEEEGVTQAVELAVSLGDDALLQSLAAGLYIDSDGKLCLSPESEVRRQVRSQFREKAGWRLLSASGGLRRERKLRVPLSLSEANVGDYLDAPAVETLSISSYEGPDLEFLERFPALRDLSINWLDAAVTGLGKCTNLERFFADGKARGTDASQEAAKLPRLRAWRTGEIRVSSLDWTRELPFLEALEVAGAESIEGLTGTTSLREIELNHCRGTSLAPLRGNAGLRRLRLHSLGELEDLSALAALSGLQSLWVTKCSRLEHLEPISGLAELTALRVEECKCPTVDYLFGKPLGHLRAFQRRLREGKA